MNRLLSMFINDAAIELLNWVNQFRRGDSVLIKPV